MKTKQIREIQVSSSQLALIFLVMLGIAVIIFLLGVSIGKKYRETQQEETKLGSIVESQPLSSETLTKKSEEIPPITEKKGPTEPTSEPLLKAKPETKEISATSPLLKPEMREEKIGFRETEVTKTVEAKKAVGGAYFVQIGAFAKKEAATKLIQVLKKAGYQPILLNPLATDKIPLYRLRVGPFSSPSEAEAARMRLSSIVPEAAKAIIIRQ